MAGTLNKVMLIGNLGKDPETKRFEGGGILVRFPIATSESYNNREGQKVTLTEWHNIVVGRKGLAEVCEKYLKKGQKVFIEGRIRTRQWTDDQNQTRYSTEINADNMTMLGGPMDSTNTATSESSSNENTSDTPQHTPQQTSSSAQAAPTMTNFQNDGNEDDLPF
ncbi:MAG: single-stranded DNA-binding protein [Schleiferiaceae bacterium]|nr:single-stranded DNA-binding protein [Schleiferiaceae bacterium]